MSVLSTRTKAKVGSRVARGAIKNPGAARRGAQLGLWAYTPIVRRRARKRIASVGGSARSVSDTARTYTEMLATYGPGAAQELGLVSKPKPKRTAPRVAAGVIIGAGAVYFLEPEHGAQRREKALSKVG
jgi:hypothetical protein